jgi:5-formyltetrahydrofolate cyclo-ligase
MDHVDTSELDRVLTKLELRERLLSARAELTPEQLAAAGRSLAVQVLARPEVAEATTVALYVSTGTEPPTGRLRAELRSRGVNVLLPVLRVDGDLDWAPDQGDAALVPGRYGINEPAGPWLGRSALAAADVVLVPALAVAVDGTRLGRGGGSYDRALPRVPEGVQILALLYAGEVLEPGVIPVEAHDAPVSGWVEAPEPHAEGDVLLGTRGAPRT